MINRGFVLLALLLPYVVFAEADSWLEKDRININIGAFSTDYDSEGRVSSGELGLGTKISFEDDLGLDNSKTVFRLDTSFRLDTRHSLQFSYIDLDRDGNNVTSRTLIIDETVYPAGSRLDTEFEYQVYKLAYTYSVWQDSGYDLGFTTGLHVFDIDLNIESDVADKEGAGGTSPFPMIGLRGSWQLTPQWFLRNHIEYFEISEGDIEGRLIDFMILIERRFGEHWGTGFGYNKLDVDAENTEENDEMDYVYEGFLLYLNLRY